MLSSGRQTSAGCLDTNCDGEVDLSEYLTYILFEHQQREIMYGMSKPMPYPTSPKEVTTRSLSLDLYIGVRQTLHSPSRLTRRAVSILSGSTTGWSTPRSHRLHLRTVHRDHTPRSRLALVDIVESHSRRKDSTGRPKQTVSERKTNIADSSILIDRFLSGSPAWPFYPT